MSGFNEPWRVDYEITGENAWDPNGSAWFAIKDANDVELFSIDRDEQELAERIVACINACRGLSNEMLEVAVTDGFKLAVVDRHNPTRMLVAVGAGVANCAMSLDTTACQRQ